MCVLLESIVQSLIITHLYVQYTKMLLENKNDIPSSGTLRQSDAVPTVQAHLVPSLRGQIHLPFSVSSTETGTVEHWLISHIGFFNEKPTLGLLLLPDEESCWLAAVSA